ncbi:hypothetical protein SADUNF_Sadunf06G0077600 [Salix dunnii]|uniref:Uncharacterized protein n=1 Tax=Salix dunnii TaxID=1413687 RepID=A0A835MX06_9ROSI|nr:hypothetical protein SADUNF_Sadunf06G0077600 [Salix dunnii]
MKSDPKPYTKRSRFVEVKYKPLPDYSFGMTPLALEKLANGMFNNFITLKVKLEAEAKKKTMEFSVTISISGLTVGSSVPSTDGSSSVTFCNAASSQSSQTTIVLSVSQVWRIRSGPGCQQIFPPIPFSMNLNWKDFPTGSHNPNRGSSPTMVNCSPKEHSFCSWNLTRTVFDSSALRYRHAKLSLRIDQKISGPDKKKNTYLFLGFDHLRSPSLPKIRN